MSSSLAQFIYSQIAESSPFNLDNPVAYENWRQWKLESFPDNVASLIVLINDPGNLSVEEKNRIVSQCEKTNTVIYRCQQVVIDKEMVRTLGHQLGLNHLDENLCSDEDGISGLQVMGAGSRHEGYIPYTNKPINWHTDGYYNNAQQKIKALILHCESDSATGGENAILDHEMVYILMRDHDPEMVRAFMQKDVMTIPENRENGVLIRSAQTGPVFSVDENSGYLHMRYTARKRSIEWKQDTATTKAISFIENLLNSQHEFIFHYRLQPGEGIISNNALHNRTGFINDDEAGKNRLIYRARFFDRVQ